MIINNIVANSLLDRGIAITIILFILSLISERFITFCKLYFTNGKFIPFLITKAEDLSLKGDSPEAEKKREARILRLNIILSVIIALLAKANLFAIMASDPPYSALGWHAFQKLEISNIPHYIKVAFGCVMGGLFISLGSKFWHDMLDMLLYSKNLKDKLVDKASYEVTTSQELDEWIKITQGDMVRKVFEENKEMLRNLKNVIGVGITQDEQNNKCIEVVTDTADTELIPKSLYFNIPNGNIKEVKIKTRVSSGIVTHLKIGDDITNQNFKEVYGTSGLVVCYKHDVTKSPMLLTCYHVVIGSKNNFDHFITSGTENVINPHGNDGQIIGTVVNAIKNNEIDVALIKLVDANINNAAPDGTKIKGMREIKYEEQYNKVAVKMYGFNKKGKEQSGRICSTRNNISVNYTLPDGTLKEMPLENTIAAISDTDVPFSEKGDSGSVVLDKFNAVVGIIVAGDSDVSYIIPIHTILNQLNIEII